jgi:hypothetical protein
MRGTAETWFNMAERAGLRTWPSLAEQSRVSRDGLCGIQTSLSVVIISARRSEARAAG